MTKAKKKGEEATTKVLLNNIDAEARAGEILAVVGPSGAGKSTFLDAIAGRCDKHTLVFSKEGSLVWEDDCVRVYVKRPQKGYPREHWYARANVY